MHQRNRSSSLSDAPGLSVAVILRSSSVISLGTAWTTTSAREPCDMRMLSTSKLRDVLAPAAEVVGLAVDEEEVAVVVDPADVAGVVPPVRGWSPTVASGRPQ